MCSKARCNATRIGCGSTPSSSTAESGAHLWADRFEEDVADLFKLQDQVVARLGNALGFELVKAEAEKSARSRNPDAIDLDMRGRALVLQTVQQPAKDKNDAALALFDQALKIDPNDADALAEEAHCYLIEYVYFANPETDYDAKVIGQADRAIALAPDNMRAYLAKSIYLTISRRANEALRTADAGLAINPNYASLYLVRSSAEIFSRPVRTSQVRCSTSDAVEFARSVHRSVACVFGQCGTWPRAFRRRSQRIPQRNRLSVFAPSTRTQIWPPPMHSKARWKKRRPPWRKPVASIRISPSNT